MFHIRYDTQFLSLKSYDATLITFPVTCNKHFFKETKVKETKVFISIYAIHLILTCIKTFRSVKMLDKGTNQTLLKIKLTHRLAYSTRLQNETNETAHLYLKDSQKSNKCSPKSLLATNQKVIKFQI